MTDAELVAYNLGQQIEADVLEHGTCPAEDTVTSMHPLTGEQMRSLEILDEVQFSYWVLKGAMDAAERSGR